MQLKRIAVLLLMLLTVSFLGSCAAPKENVQTSSASSGLAAAKLEELRIGTTKQQNIFSALSTDDALGKMNYNSFTQLFFLEWDENNRIQPSFMRTWKFSQDAMEMTFTFPAGLYFHDGKPVTGEDVKFTLDFMVNVQKKADPLKSTEIVDEHTLKLHFAKPAGLQFLSSITSVGSTPILAKHIWENIKEPDKYRGADALIGCGPYKFVSYDKDAQISYYESTGDNFKGKVSVPKVSLKTFGGQEALVMALSNGQIDAVYDYSNPIDPALIEVLASKKNVDPGQSENTGNYQLAFGCKTKPCDDLAFRKGVAYALDYPRIASTLGGDSAEIAGWGIIAPRNQGFDASLPKMKQDIAAARDALDKGGYRDVNGDGFREMPDGSKMDVMVTMQNGLKPEMFARLYEILEKNLASVGVKVRLDEESVRNRDVWTAHMNTGDYEIYLGVCTTGVAPFGTSYRYLLNSSTLKAGTCPVPQMNTPYQKAITALSYEEYIPAIMEVQKQNQNYIAGIGLCWDKTFYPYRTDKIEGWVQYPAWGVINNKTWYALKPKAN